MTSKGIIWLLAVSALLLGVLQTLALEYYLYWTVWWFDILMHFLGGFWIGLIVLWFYKAFLGERARSDHGYLVSLLGVILVGVAWEVMELLGGLTGGEEGYAFDTILDLIMDIVGAIVATYVVFRKSLKPVNEEHNG